MLLPPDAADPLPAVVGPRTETQRFAGIPDAVAGTGLDGQSQLLALRGRASVLPRALGDGVLVDPERASALSDPSLDQAEPQVWLAAGASPAVVDRLVRAGVVVEGRELLATERDRLLRSPAALGSRLAAAMGAVALVLALLTVVAGRVAGASRRQADWIALGAAGVPRAQLRRLARVEIALPPVLGAALGAGAGWLAASLAAVRLPVVDLAAAGPPLDLTLSWLPLVVVLGTTVVVLVLVLVAGALALTETRDRSGRR
ncbi:FtsX-like permease family protein [Phycicoccus ginsengisoli]